ncbi:metallophosphoesterase family protein [Dethiobacter alkaliphilus]|uniref:metallophosphoesterase family protein n=1 Tax=Dethiobacter alkaliphilus TaxID=427926 RepID=UPI0022263C28|nr:metallophosphoesterase [Dethiobacter alkaliphilus]MCW3490756.1 metallophosphoesterase [Dethiobacter alkaliphilus]
MNIQDRRQLVSLVLLAVVGMLAFVSLFSSYTTVIDAFQLEMDLMIFDHGFTELSMPPLGLVRAQTHMPPLMFRVTLTNINLDKLQAVLEKAEDQEYLDGLRDTAQRQINIFLVRLLALAFVGGLAGPFIFGERDRKRLLIAGMIGMVVLGILLVSAYATFEPMAFMYPEFEGILEAAPWMFGLLEETLFRVRSLGEQLQLIAANMSILFEQIERLEPLGTVEGELKVAHVSDLHNNPAGMDFIKQVVRTFDIHLVIDTGDITDFGTQIEAGLAAPIELFDIPYIFIPGNHDSPEVVDRVQAIDNVTVLEEGQIEVLGLRVAGITDPSAGDSGMVVPADYVLDEFADRLQAVIDEADEAPHVVTAHHPRIARRFLGQVPVILTGHLHQVDITERDESVLINAGTTGASGIRGLQARQETPFSLVLLHYGRQAEEELYLKAADVIRVFQLQSGFSMERHLFGSVAIDDGEQEFEIQEEDTEQETEDIEEP